jgi:hypothetical protein
MKSVFKYIAMAAALAASGSASAFEVTLNAGKSVTTPGLRLDKLTGTGTLTFSNALLPAMNAGGVQVETVAPAIVHTQKNTRMKYTAISAVAPVTSLSGDVVGDTLVVASVATAGGALQTAEDDGLTNTGGSLAITNLQVDLAGKRVYADIEGANGIGLMRGVHLWNFASITGPTSLTFHWVNDMEVFASAANEITGLSITSDSFQLFSQSLGLLEDGVSALSKVTDFGRINSTITIGVPEPSTYALMGMGLLVLGMAARRRRTE